MVQSKYVMVRYLNHFIRFVNIKENIRDERKSKKHNGVELTKLLESQLPLIINFKLWY